MLLNYGMPSLLILLCAALCVHAGDDKTPKRMKPATIAIEPLQKPPVDTEVIFRCNGPLSNGGALIYDGQTEGTKSIEKENRGKTLVTFKKFKAPNSRPKLMLSGPRKDDFTGVLDNDRDGAKLKFRVSYSDNGYYKCVFFDSDTQSVKLSTDSVLLESFYPPGEPVIEYKQVHVKADKFKIDISCKGYVGYPAGNVLLTVDGIKSLDVKTKKEKPSKDRRGDTFEVTGHFPALLKFNGSKAFCTSGGGKNPMTKNTTEILNVEVPVQSPVIEDTKLKFRHVGSDLVCTARGNPPPEYSWRLMSEPTNDTTPAFKVPSKPGVYSAVCVVTNKILGREYVKRKKFLFAVVPKGTECVTPTKEVHEDASNVSLIVAAVFAALFGVVALVAIILLIMSRKRSQYNQM